MTRRPLLAVVCVIGLIFATRAGAQQPERTWTADHPYNITPNAGPWAICVMSYSGKTAFNLSEKFVTELRRDYRLPAYFFNRSDIERKKEEERVEEMKKKRWALYGALAQQMGQADPNVVAPEKVWVKRVRYEDQFAVLIGGYRDMDSARRSLEFVRKLKPPSDDLMNHAVIARPAADGAEVQSAAINPFQTAFVVPNPTAPKAKPTEADDKESEAALRELNAEETFSLLKCPGTWTLVVKVYRAPTIVLSMGQDRGMFDRKGPKSGNYMSAAARQAHQLAEVLRSGQLSFESYVLHTNNMSMVTVGSFGSQTDPRMEETANRIAKLKLQVQGQPTPFESLMTPPMPFQVPKPK